MALDKTALQAQRDSLKKAIRSGVLKVQHGDKLVQYRSMADLQVALDGVNSDLAKLCRRPRGNVRYFNITKDLG